MINRKMSNNKKRLMRVGSFLSLFAMLVSCFIGGVIITQAGDTLIVDDDGTGDYTSIQDAIDNASSGDYIVVKSGTYGDQLTVDVSVSIVGGSGENPTIYASSYGVGIDVSAPDVLISGFEIYGNGSLTGGPFPTIRASAGSIGLYVDDNDFKVFTGQRGQAALQIMDNVVNVTFSNNEIEKYDKGVLMQPGSIATILSNNYSDVTQPLCHAANIPGQNIFYGSIQSAINAVDPNGHAGVNVMAGTYNENIVIDKNLDFRGAQFNVNPINGRPGGESIIDGGTSHAVTVANGIEWVYIDGFKITISSKTSTGSGAGILLANNTRHIRVRNNIIENITDGSGVDQMSDETYGILIYGHDVTGGQSDIVIENNLIQNVEEYGIAINDKTANVTINDNLITNLIGSNHVDFPDPSWPSWICAAIYLGGQVGPINNVDIINNIFNTNVMGDGTAAAAGGGVLFKAAPVWGGFDQITIANNHIYGNTMGILSLEGEFNDPPAIHSNNISGNAEYGISNTIVNINFNATNNWWGNISGPYHPTSNPAGIGDTVSDNVTYCPWYEFDSYSIAPRVGVIIGLPQAEDGLYVSDSTSFRLEAADYESGMDSLFYRIWNTTHRWSNWLEYTGTFTLSGEGKHFLQYNATDMAGTKSMATQIHYVDIQEPWVEVSYPNGGESLRGLVSINWNASDKILDQEQQKWNGSWSLSNDYPGHIQSFIPTESVLSSISLLLSGDEADVTLILFSTITPIPVPIAETSEHLEDIGDNNNPEWVEFAFNSDIILDPDTTYYIGVTQENIGNIGYKWYNYNNTGGVDPYVYGQSWLKKTDLLESQPQWDWGFRTMYWENDLNIDIQYSPIGGVQWITLGNYESNDGVYLWDTTSFPDGIYYKIRVIASDKMELIGIDESDEVFTVDQTGPIITDIIINDVSIENTNYVKDGDDVKITATISGNPNVINADLSGFGKGSSVSPTRYIGDTVTWDIPSVVCLPSDGTITVIINATDQNDDTSSGAGQIVADNSVPEIDVLRPLPGIYLWNSQRILPYAYPVVFGEMTVRIDATDLGSGIDKVEFYRTLYPDSELMATIQQNPYEWLWDERAFGFFKIKIIAYDTVGLNSTSMIDDIYLINFDLIN